MEDTSHCDYCGEKSSFVLEWYGVNQYGENPLVAQEIGVCKNFGHMLKITSDPLKNIYYGEPPEGVVDAETLENEYPTLAKKIQSLFNAKFEESALERLCTETQKHVDELLIPENQLTFLLR